MKPAEPRKRSKRQNINKIYNIYIPTDPETDGEQASCVSEIEGTRQKAEKRYKRFLHFQFLCEPSLAN